MGGDFGRFRWALHLSTEHPGNFAEFSRGSNRRWQI
jgi:hypothetical protein